MAFIPGLDVAQVEIRQTLVDQKVENTLYWLHNTGISVVAMEALADYIAAWWNTEIRPTQSNQVVHREVYVTDLTTSTSPTYTSTDFNGVAGGSTSPALPGNNSITVSFRTLGRGRSSRGRNYYYGLTEGEVVNNTVDAGLITAIGAAYREFITAPPADWTWVVASRQVNNAPRVAIATYPITQVVFVDNYIDSQRRRLPGRGQ